MKRKRRNAGASDHDPARSPSASVDIEPPGPASPGLAAAARRLARRTGELTERVLEDMRKIPEYAALEDPVVWNEIRELTPGNIRLYYTTVIEGRMPREQEMTTARYFARRRVEQGISLRALRSAYASGVRLLWGELVREVAAKAKLQRELLERSSWAFQHLDVFNSAVAEAYYEAQEGRSRHRDQLTRDLFDEIIDGDPSSVAALETRARLAGLEVDADFHVLVVEGPAGSPASEGLPPAHIVVACADAAGVTPEQVVAARRGRELFFVIPGPVSAVDPRVLRRKLGEAIARLPGDVKSAGAGVSGTVTGAAGLRQGYSEGKRAIELGRDVGPGESVHFYDHYVLQDLLDSSPEQGRRLIDQTIRPLLELGEPGERLIETLHEYFRAGLNLKMTAATLHLHRNTLTYRLRQIRQLTGLDLENPEQRILAENALQVLMLQRRRSGRPGERSRAPRPDHDRQVSSRSGVKMQNVPVRTDRER